MNKSNVKPKLFLVPKGKKAPKVANPPVRASSASKEAGTLEQLATVEFWKEEIASLKAGEFNSVAEATEKLIDQVLERLKLNNSGEEDVKEFLRLVFDSSDVLQQTLKKGLGLS